MLSDRGYIEILMYGRVTHNAGCIICCEYQGNYKGRVNYEAFVVIVLVVLNIVSFYENLDILITKFPDVAIKHDMKLFGA